MTYTPTTFAFGAAVAVAIIGLLTLYIGRLVAGTATAACGFAAATVIAAVDFGPLLAVALLLAAATCAALLVSSLRLLARLDADAGPPPADTTPITYVPERSTR